MKQLRPVAQRPVNEDTQPSAICLVPTPIYQTRPTRPDRPPNEGGPKCGGQRQGNTCLPQDFHSSEKGPISYRRQEKPPGKPGLFSPHLGCHQLLYHHHDGYKTEPQYMKVSPLYTPWHQKTKKYKQVPCSHREKGGQGNEHLLGTTITARRTTCVFPFDPHNNLTS